MSQSSARPRADCEVALKGRLAVAPVHSANECRFAVEIHDESGRRHSIDCVATSSRVLMSLASSTVGSRLAVTGSLRRRYWRSARGVSSRLVVDVASLRRIR